MRRLRKIGKYLIGSPRLVSKFVWQDMPTKVTSFTDSDWAGCVKTARSTSGGAICLGEHVLKAYCRQQKVVALSSAEAELYAMVAASAETLAMAAYASDLGLSLECELFCDSSAALGIAQRAGIGKVRHLRTQGLWVQEVRVGGRIQYRKVLGSKNPADLMTKHMTAELSKQHLTTLSMKIEGGRAESAPTLDSVESFVQGWYEDMRVDGQEEIIGVDRGGHGERRVRFNPRVQVRPVPEEGRGRSTPPRGTRAAITQGRGIREYFVDSVSSAEQGEMNICRCRMSGFPFRGTGLRWSELEDDLDCVVCASRWTAPSTATRTTSGGAARAVSSVGRLACTSTDRVESSGVSGCEPVDPSVKLSVRCAAPNRAVCTHDRSVRLPTRKSARASLRRRAFAEGRVTVFESPIPRRGVVEGGALVCAPSQCRYRDMRRYADRQSHSAATLFPPGLKCVQLHRPINC